MTTLTIQISDQTAQRLKVLAEKSGLSLQETVRIYLDEQATRLDDDFDEVASEVLQRNEELYDRLS